MRTLNARFERSFEHVMSTEVDGKRFVDRFYEHFLASDAAVAKLFRHTHMTQQKTMLHDSLHDLVDFARSERARESLTRTAMRHGPRELDIPERAYALWLSSLLATVEEFDPRFDPRTADAWRSVLAPGITYMQRPRRDQRAGR